MSTHPRMVTTLDSNTSKTMDTSISPVDRLHALTHEYQSEINFTMCLRSLIELIDSVAVWQSSSAVNAVVDHVEQQLAGYVGIMQEMQGQ